MNHTPHYHAILRVIHLILLATTFTILPLHAMNHAGLAIPVYPTQAVLPPAPVFLPSTEHCAPHQASPVIYAPVCPCCLHSPPPIPYDQIINRVAHLCDATACGASQKLFHLLGEPLSRSLVQPHSWQLLKNCIDRDDVIMAHHLFCAGANPHKHDPVTLQPLIARAAYTNNDHPNMLQLLHYAGAHPPFQQLPNGELSLDKWHSKLLSQMVMQKKFNKAEILLTLGLPLDGIPKNVTSPLIDAITVRNEDAVKYLLSRGANPNRQHACTGKTPLAIVAANANNQQAVRLAKILLYHPAIDLFSQDYARRTAYTNARENAARRYGTNKKSICKKKAAVAVLDTIQNLIMNITHDISKCGLRHDIILWNIMPFLGINIESRP